MGIFLQLFYHVGHIIVFSIELVNRNIHIYIYQIFKLHYIPSYFIMLAILLCSALNL
jgi:hypothetical protein